MTEIERIMARGICQARCQGSYARDKPCGEGLNDPCLASDGQLLLGIESTQAKQALKALSDAGYVVAPREPTAAMLDAGSNPNYVDGRFLKGALHAHYQAMIEAFEKESG